MNSQVNELTADTDKLLVEIGFAGAMYGAGAVCGAIYDYLKAGTAYASSASLAEALSLIAMKQYDLASAYLEKFLALDIAAEERNAAMSFLALCYGIAGDDAKLKELEVSEADNQQALNMIKALAG